MRKAVEVPKTMKGKAWVGQWNDGTLGWFGCEHVHEKCPGQISRGLLKQPSVKPKRVFFCDVTFTPRTDKNGRPITRIALGDSK